MFGRLLLLFITIPVLELMIFMFLGSKIGLAATFGIIILTAILGAYLTKSQGREALKKYQEALAAGRLPHEEVMDGLMILVAGAVLLTPGFLTDTIGFLLLVPPVRHAVRGVLKSYLKDRVTVAGETMGVPTPPKSQTQGGVINVEAEIVDERAGRESREITG